MKIVHAADLHLDSAFSALTPERAKERRTEARQSVIRLCTLAEREQADLLLIAGDLFDGQRVYPDTLETLRDAFSALSSQVVIAPGNHDFYGEGCAYDRIAWSPNVHIFRHTEMERLVFPSCQTVVHGTAFRAPERSDRPLAGFAAEQDGNIHIVLLHGDTATQESRYGSVSAEEIAASGADYVALGHIHAASGVQKAGGTVYAYPGCMIGRGFDECGDKGVLLGTVEKGKVDLRFRSLEQRRYIRLPLSVTGADVPAAARAALAPYASDIVRLVLTGEWEGGSLPSQLADSLSDSVYALELRDETVMPQDVWARIGEDSLRGLFLRAMREKLESADTEEEKRLAEQAVRFGIAALDGRDL